MSYRSLRHKRVALHFLRSISVVLLALLVLAPAVSATPEMRQPDPSIEYQLPDWLSPETAMRLDIGIDVLAPSWVPAPFGGEPDVQSSDGYYSLYWLIPGAPPTFLRITGTAGGEIPAYSYYDRNVQLEQNENVMGYPAWHDVTPIYDLVYFLVGNVVYTVESHNLVDDTTLGIANSLMSLTIPETGTGGEESGTDQPDAAETPSTDTGNSISVSALNAPDTVSSGVVANIVLQGNGDVYLVTSDGYFPASGDTGIVVSANGGSVDWQAPQTDGDLTVNFGAYLMADDSLLASASTVVHGVTAVSNSDQPADLQCSATASISREARIIVIGAGGVTLNASTGSWPIEPPNTDFQPNLDGGATVSGGLGAGSTVALSWLAPETAGTAEITLVDGNGNVLDSCMIQVVNTAGAGDLGAPAPAVDGQASGDGTGISEGNRETVMRVVANPIGFAGDASGGPEANGADYGWEPEQSNDDGEPTPQPTRVAASSSARSLNEATDSKFGPSSGADGVYAITLGINGGSLASPFGATVFVPPKCLDDQTTISIKPVDDTAIPAAAGVTTVPGTAFDISFGAADGRAVERLAIPASLTIALKSSTTPEQARVYRVEGNRLELMPLTASSSTSVTTNIDGLARYVVGVPAGNAAASTSSINPFVIVGLGLLALTSAGLLISRGLAHRKPRMIPARRPSADRVRYR